MDGLSKRQVQLKFGFNGDTVDRLIHVGVLTILPDCTYLRPKISHASLNNLKEGQHYVVCMQCGAWQAQITTKHLRMCSGMNLASYSNCYPKSLQMPTWCSDNHAKTETQKVAQSDKLKKRFQTPEGEITRGQIAEASQRLMASGGLQRVTEQLRVLNKDPVQRSNRSAESKQRWVEGSQRDIVEKWHKEHRDESLQGAANARRHLKHKNTKPHIHLKGALVYAGLDTQTEYEIGYYAIDEAIPDLKIAIEVGGCYWHGCDVCKFPPVKGNARRDKSKNTYLKNRGWIVLRFPEHAVYDDVNRCVQIVQDAISQRNIKEVA